MKIMKIYGIGIVVGLTLLACTPAEHGHEPASEPHGDHEHESKGAATSLYLAPEVLQELDMAWASAENAPLISEIAVTGRVVQDTESVDYVFAPVSGKIGQILVNVGDSVQEGQLLLRVGSRGVTAPRSGNVLAINTTRGARVGTMQSLVVLADIDIMRVVFDVYPGDIDRVRLGQTVEVTLIGHPEERFRGTIRYLSPDLDPRSQTLKAAAEVANTDHHLKFGMFVEGKIQVEEADEVLLIPEEALVRFDHEYAVFVAGDAPNTFVKRPITVGRRGAGRVEVSQGLREGERVVTGGSFELKAESLRSQLGEGHSH